MSEESNVITHTAKSLADQLNKSNIQYVDLIRGKGYDDYMELCKLAAHDNLVIIRGYSDDGICFEGAISDQIGAWDTTRFFMDAKGPLPEYDDCDDEESMQDYILRKNNAVEVSAVWCRKETGYAWAYETEIPHATFDIYEDGEKWCRGIVIDLNDLQPKVVVAIPDEIAEAIAAEKQRYEGSVSTLIKMANDDREIKSGDHIMTSDQAKYFRLGVKSAIELLGPKFPFDIAGE